MVTFDLEAAFAYPFRDRRWTEKLLIALALYLFLYLILPAFFLAGYLYRLAKGALETGEARLPDWDDWGGDFRRGARALGAALLIASPVLLFVVLWLVGVFGSVFAMEGMEEAGRATPSLGFMLWGMFMLGSMSLTALLGMVLGVLGPAAWMHVVATDRLNAILDVPGWWAIFRAAWAEFVVATVLVIGLRMFVAYLMQTLFWLLCFGGFVLAAIPNLYILLVGLYLYARAYRQGAARLASQRAEASA